ncbi:uncharacterized protein J4E88_006893 [Alternaria novae-zelandiae]|uniref:uncharacterized protein n=1 Tax=Alternaria novae-zelandiae TaxID=430562 RepID=UPI0020C31FF7|nr:uncharacterized protein J4E88_006893 [Alternaria novae-zelandiae]KAI4677086.1 hypothetical protein J4E88_006893 [Alternaria novae-zelandiae]
MKESPRQAEKSLRQSEHEPGDTFAERHVYTPLDIEGNRSYLREATHSPQNAGSSHGSRGPPGQRYGHANDFSQSYMSDTGFEAATTVSRDPRIAMQTSRFVPHSDNNHLRGVHSYVDLTSPSCRDSELMSKGPAHAYSIHQRSISREGPSLAPMPSTERSSMAPQAAHQLYEPFRGLFNDSGHAKEYRQNKMRFNREPWRDPATDPTIEMVERDRDRNVERIYNAMVSGDHARDNPKSTARKRWIEEPHYQSDLVEAYAHKVFDCLLEQVRKGFRGWQQNDYVNDERKGEDEDKDTDCAGRLDNIVTALAQEKCICENVMCSAWQIRMFVNAPKAYSKRKDQNRVGNSKRPNAKGHSVPDDNPRASKRARTSAAPRTGQARGHSSPASELPLSRGNTPQESSGPTGSPYFTTPVAQRMTAFSPPSRFLAPQAPAMRPPPRSYHTSFDQRLISASSPPMQSSFTQAQTPQVQPLSPITSISPTQHSPFPPPPLPRSRFSASASPDDVKPPNRNTDPFFSPWGHAIRSDAVSPDVFAHLDPVGSSDFPGVEDWQHGVEPFPPDDASSNANLFAQHPEMGVCLADMELLPSFTVNDVVGGNVFDPWQHQDSGH